MSRDNPIRDHAGEFAAAIGVVILVVILWWVFIASLRDIDSKGPGRGLTRAQAEARRTQEGVERAQRETGKADLEGIRKESDKQRLESQARMDESSKLLRKMPLTPQAKKAVEESGMSPEDLAKLAAGPTGKITIVEVRKIAAEIAARADAAKVDSTSDADDKAAASKDDPSAEAGRAATEAGLPARTGDAEPIVPGVPQLAPDAAKTPDNAAADAQAASQAPSAGTIGDQMLAPEASHAQAAAQAAEAPTFGTGRA